MKFLIIGLGSMGRRRARCLKKLGHEVIGCDLLEERYGDIERYSGQEVNGAFICVPPDLHDEVWGGPEEDPPAFCEASVVRQDFSDLGTIYPSCTMLFHPAVKRIKKVLDSGELGQISNIIYHVGQYLPDWHPNENVKDFYVSNPATGGAREIVPFELTWITALFGFPSSVMANYRKTIDIKGAERIDDTYNILLDYRTSLASITVDVVSRTLTRRLTIVGSEGDLHVNFLDYDTSDEQMYIDETQAFIDAISGKAAFPNTLEKDNKVLTLLEKIEQSDIEGARIRI